MARTIDIYDTTLRDGCQAEDISLTLEDKYAELAVRTLHDAFDVGRGAAR